MPIAHRQKLRIPFSSAGISNVYRTALRRWPWAIATREHQPAAERGIILVWSKVLQVEPGLREEVSRQPAGAAGEVGPDILQDVGHLQALAERHREAHELVAVPSDRGRVLAEEPRQHLADDAGDVITVTIHRLEVIEPAGVAALLEPHHALPHDPHTGGERVALRRRETVRDREHARRLTDQFALGGKRGFGQERRQGCREVLGRLVAHHRAHELRGVVPFRRSG